MVSSIGCLTLVQKQVGKKVFIPIPYPFFVQWHYEKMTLFKLKKYRESVSEFQRVAHDPEFRLKALNYLGQSFYELDNLDLSEKQYAEALKNQPIVTDQVKPIIYNLAKLYIKRDNKEEAINQLNRIYEVDINFKDIADLLADLKQ